MTTSERCALGRADRLISEGVVGDRGLIASIIYEAVAAEREACARLADEFRELPHGSVPVSGLEATWAAAKQIADAIRNRE